MPSRIGRYCAAMVRTRSMRSCLVLIALAIFAIPASGAHLHLCLDGMGGEPPASVHVSDGGNHHAEEAERAHLDVDVSLESEALAKKVGGSFGIPPVLPATVVLFVLPIATSADFPRDPPALIVPIPAFRVLPPLR